MEIILSDFEKEKFSLEVTETLDGFKISLVEKPKEEKIPYDAFYTHDPFTTVWRKPDGTIVEKETRHMPYDKYTGRELKPGGKNSYDWVCQMVYQASRIDIRHLELYGDK